MYDAVVCIHIRVSSTKRLTIEYKHILAALIDSEQMLLLSWSKRLHFLRVHSCGSILKDEASIGVGYDDWRV